MLRLSSLLAINKVTEAPLAPVLGPLYSWGKNTWGELGDNTITHRSSPAQVGSLSWRQISAVGRRVSAIRSDYTLWSWGLNTVGQVGDQTVIDRSSPVQIAGSWSMVSAGETRTFGIKTDKTLWGWGYNLNGSLGVDITLPNPQFDIVSMTQDHTDQASNYSAAGIKSDGTLWTWGYNGYGQLGDGTYTARSNPVQIGVGISWKAVKVGQSCMVGIGIQSGTSKLFFWGTNDSIYGSNYLSPTQVVTGIPPSTTLGQDALDVSGTFMAYIGATNYPNDSLLVWGDNSKNQCGAFPNSAGYATGSYSSSYSYNSANIIKTTPGQNGLNDWKKVSLGEAHGVAVTNAGALVAWGDNSNGQLGWMDLVITPTSGGGGGGGGGGGSANIVPTNVTNYGSYMDVQFAAAGEANVLYTALNTLTSTVGPPERYAGRLVVYYSGTGYISDYPTLIEQPSSTIVRVYDNSSISTTGGPATGYVSLSYDQNTRYPLYLTGPYGTGKVGNDGFVGWSQISGSTLSSMLNALITSGATKYVYISGSSNAGVAGTDPVSGIIMISDPTSFTPQGGGVVGITGSGLTQVQSGPGFSSSVEFIFGYTSGGGGGGGGGGGSSYGIVSFYIDTNPMNGIYAFDFSSSTTRDAFANATNTGGVTLSVTGISPPGNFTVTLASGISAAGQVYGGGPTWGRYFFPNQVQSTTFPGPSGSYAGNGTISIGGGALATYPDLYRIYNNTSFTVLEFTNQTVRDNVVSAIGSSGTLTATGLNLANQTYVTIQFSFSSPPSSSSYPDGSVPGGTIYYAFFNGATVISSTSYTGTTPYALLTSP